MDQTSYIVFDLEWNQSAEGKQGEVRELPFEILEIGAVKLNSSLEPVGEFSCVIRPVVYTRLHYKVLEITHVGMEELKKRGVPFAEAVRSFLSWCREAGEEAENRPSSPPVFCTWGNMDLT